MGSGGPVAYIFIAFDGYGLCIHLQTEYVKNDIETIEKSLKETLVPEVSSALYDLIPTMKYAMFLLPAC